MAFRAPWGKPGEGLPFFCGFSTFPAANLSTSEPEPHGFSHRLPAHPSWAPNHQVEVLDMFGLGFVRLRVARNEVWHSKGRERGDGCGSKSNRRGYAGGLCLHLPGQPMLPVFEPQPYGPVVYLLKRRRSEHPRNLGRHVESSQNQVVAEGTG